MDCDSEKWTGFLVDFAWTVARDKDVPIHVYEHTFSRNCPFSDLGFS